MRRLTDFFREIHRRSVWQVLGAYVASSWGVIEVAEFVTAAAGLPEWTPTMAFVLALVGLPVVLATAVVQGGMKARAQPWPVEVDPNEGSVRPSGHPADEETTAPPSPVGEAPESPRSVAGSSGLSGILTWRNAGLGAVGALALLGLVSVGYVVSWRTGIGPAGNLLAQGVLDEGDPVLLADFANASDDPRLDEVVTEALRVDLSGAATVSLVQPEAVRATLSLMQRDPATPLEPELAREVALRRGIPAVLEGSVGSAGTGYVLTATLREVASGEAVGTFRQTAASAGQLVSAIEALSRDIRERVGESLSTLRQEPALARVTTSSLEALRDYTAARRLSNRGEPVLAIEKYRDAVERDSTFASAWRGLAVELGNTFGFTREGRDAAARAWSLRERLTSRERYLSEAMYHNRVTGDLEAERLAYEALLVEDPDDGTALNNLATILVRQGRWNEAVSRLERVIRGGRAARVNYQNHVRALAGAGLWREMDEVIAQALERFPGLRAEFATHRYRERLFAGDPGGALALLRDAGPTGSPGVELQLQVLEALHPAYLGRIDDARRQLLGLVERLRAGGPPFAVVAAYRPLFDVALLTAPEWIPGDVGRFQRLDAPRLDSVAGYLGFPMAAALAIAGDRAAAAGEMERTAAAVTTPYGLRVVEAQRRVVEAVPDRERDPAALIEAISRARAATGCDRCLALFQARALAADHKWAEAAAEYEMVVSEYAAPDLIDLAATAVLDEYAAVLFELGRDEEAREALRRFVAAFVEAQGPLEVRVERARSRLERIDEAPDVPEGAGG